MFDPSQVRQYIRHRSIKQLWLAQQLGISDNTLRRKLKGESQFTLREVQRLTEILNLTPQQRDAMFFGEGELTWSL